MLESKCRLCGCTQDRACVTRGYPCYWVVPGLCSGCLPKAAHKATLTVRQLLLLIWCMRAKQAAAYAPGARMGGARRRMMERLADKGMLNAKPPFAITKKGERAAAGRAA
jgi:hypothetical protein